MRELNKEETTAVTGGFTLEQLIALGLTRQEARDILANQVTVDGSPPPGTIGSAEGIQGVRGTGSRIQR